MKDISKFVNERVRRSKEKVIPTGDKEVSDEYYASGGKLMKMATLKSDMKKTKNSSAGRFSIGEPTEPPMDLSKFTKDTNKSKKALLAKFRAKEDFFVVGKAGWAKSSIIESLAAAFNLKVARVFLDKALATDLGGIPIPQRNKSGIAHQEYAMPGWAADMLEDSDSQYLLFFDELNQAPTDVQNALMPIVLNHEICGIKFDNFFVGAAGNFDTENRGVSNLEGPLKSRFKPIIVWESNTDKSWQEAFDWLHSKWDSSFGYDFVEKFHENGNANLFANPRELDQKVFKFIKNLVNSDGDNTIYDAEDYADRLKDLKRDEPELERTELEKLDQLGEFLYDYVTSGGESKKSTTKKSTKNLDMIPEEVQEAILKAMRDGYVSLNNTKYGFCEDNINDLFTYDGPDALVNAEQVKRYIKKLKADGIDWYYKSINDIKKDPNVVLYEE